MHACTFPPEAKTAVGSKTQDATQPLSWNPRPRDRQTQLEQRGVRNAQLASLRLKSVQRDGGSNLDQTPSAAGRGPLSPAVVGLRQTAALRKPLRSAAGTAENAPTPATTRSGGGGGGYSSSPVAVGSPSWLSDGGEDSAFSALEPLVSF